MELSELNANNKYYITIAYMETKAYVPERSKECKQRSLLVFTLEKKSGNRLKILGI